MQRILSHMEQSVLSANFSCCSKELLQLHIKEYKRECDNQYN